MTTDEMRQAAALLDTIAGDLPDLAVDLAAFHRPDVWTGRRADDFGRELDGRHRQLRMTADELRRQATDLRLRARVDDLLVGPTSAG